MNANFQSIDTSPAATLAQDDQRAILTVCLMAAFVDGDKHAREREEIKRIAEGLAHADAVHLPTLYQDTLLGRITLPDAAARITDAKSKQLAYEMAVCVCDADGAQSPAERRFLDQLRAALGLEAAAAESFVQKAETIALAPLAPVAPLTPVHAVAAGSDTDTVLTTPLSTAQSVDDATLDQDILKAAILNGALELLPETLSTMAIIPLQMKLVYRIGQAHGFELDRGHIKDFLATAGVGLTSQYLEQVGRKLIGGLLGKVGGGLLGGAGRQAVSSGMSFAATYALGHVAKRYYAGGRTLSTQMLKDSYAGVLQKAQGVQAEYLPAMREQARTLDAAKVLSMVRGG